MGSESLAARIIERPFPDKPKRAAARLADVLQRAAAEDLASYRALAALAPDLDGFLAAVFDGSPFLHDLAQRDPARLVRLLGAPPEQSRAAVLDTLATVDPGLDQTQLKHRLRLAKQEMALLLGLADLGGVFDLQAVTNGLSAFAESACRAALSHALRAEHERGRLTLSDVARPMESCGLFLLAMGKLGALELNYSSDIDLIAFYERDRLRVRDADEHQSVMVRVVQTFTRLMQERDHDGIVFRVDWRLRPDPGSYPVAISTALGLAYYESLGQTWERAAMIKARPIAGDIGEGERFLAELRPFVYRRYLDYAALAEVHAMKRQIDVVKGHGSIAVAGHDLKLGRGGIREIEFFAQTQQLIGGGRDKRLRRHATRDALEGLVQAGWIADNVRRDLMAAYEMLRRLEHRAQMVADEQTHRLPSASAALTAFARFSGFASKEALSKALLATLTTVERHYARLFEEAAESARETLDFFGAETPKSTLTALAKMGFTDPRAAATTARDWLSGRYPALRTSVARDRLAECLPGVMEALAATGEPDAGVVAFDRFIARLPTGVQVFSLLKSNPKLLRLFADVLATAPRLSSFLARRPRVLDGLIEQFNAGAIDPLSDIDARLSNALEESRDLEDALDRARVFAQEQVFLIGVRLLGGTIGADVAGHAYTRLGTVLVRALHERVAAEHRRRYGVTPANMSAVVALGKFGSGEMTATSDLDLILLYDDPFDAPSDGPKSLYASEYYTRLTQRLVAALSAPTAEGIVYAVDFRLRPSGNKGPLATSLSSFLDYQRKEAWTWEHMALTRARVVSAPESFTRKIDAEIARVLSTPRDPAKLAKDIREMRDLLAKEKPPKSEWDIKMRPGGLVDLEFAAQWLVLRHGERHPSLMARGIVDVFRAARSAGLLTTSDAHDLLEAARLYHTVTQLLRLTVDGEFDVEGAPKGLLRLVAGAAGFDDIEATARALDATTRRVARLVQGYLSRE